MLIIIMRIITITIIVDNTVFVVAVVIIKSMSEHITQSAHLLVRRANTVRLCRKIRAVPRNCGGERVETPSNQKPGGRSAGLSRVDDDLAQGRMRRQDSLL